MTKQQQIDTLQKQLDAANEQIAAIDNALKEQYVNTATGIISLKRKDIDNEDTRTL